MTVFRRHRPPRVSTAREAMAVLRDTSGGDLAEALRRADHDPRATPLDDSLTLLAQWFHELPPDRTAPAMTFHEFIRLLHQALRD